jgi:hypothetical protein
MFSKGSEKQEPDFPLGVVFEAPLLRQYQPCLRPDTGISWHLLGKALQCKVGIGASLR